MNKPWRPQASFAPGGGRNVALCTPPTPFGNRRPYCYNQQGRRLPDYRTTTPERSDSPIGTATISRDSGILGIARIVVCISSRGTAAVLLLPPCRNYTFRH